MRRITLFLALLAVATSAAAQVSRITRTPVRSSSDYMPGFSLGPRLSSYSTDTDFDIVTIETGRQTSFGLVGEFRSGAFVLDFLYDHDPENGIQLSDLLPIEFGNFSRDRGEVAIGWNPVAYLDLQGGLRLDSVSIGGRAFGGSIFDGEDFDYSGILAGVKVHTASNKPFGLYGIARGYVGSVDFGGSGPGSKSDMSGRRFEGGVIIPIGESNWHAVPGVEYEYFESDDNRVAMDTNRFFVNFVYTMPR